MLYLKQCLTKKEKFNLSVLIEEVNDYYSEFYLTKNKLRLYIKDNLDVLFKSLNKGDKIVLDTEQNGIAIITGFAEKKIKIFNITTQKEEFIDSRKMVKVLVKNEKIANKLLQFINWHFTKVDLFIKIKSNNPLLKIFYENGYTFFHGRGKEILIKRKGDPNFREFIPMKD